MPRLAHGLHLVVEQERKIFPSYLFNQTSLNTVLDALPGINDVTQEELGGYTQPSRDSSLLKKAINHNAKYLFSTSTVTSLLAHLYYCISGFRSPNFAHLGVDFMN